MYYFKCPSCTNDTRFYRVKHKPIERRSFSLWLGGPGRPLNIIRRFTRPLVQCGHCGFVFRRPRMPSSSAARLGAALFVCAGLAVVLGYTIQRMPHLLGGTRAWEYVGTMEQLIEANRTGLAVAILFGVPVLVLVTLVVGGISKWRRWRSVVKEFQTHPTEFPPQTEVEAAPPTHCPECNYDLTGNITGRCSECGAVFDEGIEDDLHTAEETAGIV